MGKITKKGKSGLSAMAVLASLAVILNTVLSANATTISTYLGTSSADEEGYSVEELYQMGVDLSARIEEEGAVLLKNENNALPLAEGEMVSLLGSMSINYVIGGTGSGGGADDENTVMMKDAFEQAGLLVNPDLYEWLAQALGNSTSEGLTHTAAGENVGVDGAGLYNDAAAWNNALTPELELSEETYASWQDSTGKTAAEAIGDYRTAIVTFSRTGTEGGSLTVDKDGDGSGMTGTTYLELTENERALLRFCKENFTKTIVLINSACPMELGFIDNEAYNVEGCLWIGHPGEAGLVGVGNILAGKVSPSGSLADTFAYDMSTLPGYYGNGDTRYANLGGNNSIWASDDYFFKTNGAYLYSEGIYVGYRYYETADAEGYFETDAFKNTKYKNDPSDALRTEEQLADGGSERSTEGGYDNVVQFPFGYGLSYTTFEQEIVDSSINLTNGATNSITVKVTNTGDMDAKTAVQLYLEAPYNTDENCGIKGQGMEKSAKVLIGFEKTDVIAAGESAEVTISFEADDLASYDYTGYGCYVLEKGEYQFHVSDDAHTVIDTVTETLADTIVYNEDGAGKRASDETVAVNHLDDVSAGDGNLTCDTYLSRSDFAAGMETLMQYTPGEGEGLGLELGEEQKNAVLTTGTDSYEYTYTYYKNGEKTTATKTLYNQASTNSFNAEVTPDGLGVNDEAYQVTVGSTATAYTLADMIDPETEEPYAFDDPKWDELVSQMTLDELIELQGHEGWGRSAVESVGSPDISVVDGPQEAGNGNGENCTWWPSEVVLAATMNEDLAEKMGEIYGWQAANNGQAGAYAPAMDTHRSPFGGRNFEYFSEDGFLAGKLGTREVAGIQSTHTMIYIKHFMLNDNDDNRNGAFTWCNEQAIREIYGRPFEIAVKEGGALGIMASLNRIGMSSQHYGLYVNIVRDEWGFKGHFITDGLGPLADAGQALFNTPSICTASIVGILDKGNTLVNSEQYVAVDGDAAYTTEYGKYMLQKQAKYALYQAVCTSSVSRSVTLNTIWIWGWVAIDVILAAALAAVYLFKVHKGVVLPLLNKKEKQEGEK